MSYYKKKTISAHSQFKLVYFDEYGHSFAIFIIVEQAEYRLIQHTTMLLL